MNCIQEFHKYLLISYRILELIERLIQDNGLSINGVYLPGILPATGILYLVKVCIFSKYYLLNSPTAYLKRNKTVKNLSTSNHRNFIDLIYIYQTLIRTSY